MDTKAQLHYLLPPDPFCCCSIVPAVLLSCHQTGRYVGHRSTTPPPVYPPTLAVVALLRTLVPMSVCFVSQTGQDVAPMDTEAQVAEVKQAMEEEMDADAELLGLKRKKKPAADATAAGAGAGSSGAAPEGAAGEGAAEASTSGAAGDDELVRGIAAGLGLGLDAS